MDEEIKDFPEEKLHEILMNIKKLKQQVLKINKERKKLEKEYTEKYNSIEWKKREGKYYFIRGDRDEEIYYCQVLKVTDDEKELEFINVAEGYFSIEKIIGKKDELKDFRWSEISKQEYEKEKADKQFAE